MKKEELQIVDLEAHALYEKERNKKSYTQDSYTLSNGFIVYGKSAVENVLSAISECEEYERDEVMTWYKAHLKAKKRVKMLMKRAFGSEKTNEVIKKDSYSVLLEKKDIVIKLLGSLYTIEEVRNILKSDRYGIAAVSKDIIRLKAEYAEGIERASDKFRDEGELNDIRLFVKRGRVEELAEMYNKRKAEYDISGDRADERALLEIMAAVRKEVDGDKAVVNNYLNVNTEHNINNHINTNGIVQNLPVMDIVMSRLASRTGVSPAALINSIHNTPYSKSFETGEIPAYPSESNYNFDQLAKIIEDKKNAEVVEPIIEQVRPVTPDIKSKILERLKQKK